MPASSAQVLDPAAGWAVVIALGIGFAFVMLGISYIQERYTQFSVKTNEEFSSASRSVKTGLIAASIVSAWTWAATILQSCSTAHKFGVSGPCECRDRVYGGVHLRGLKLTISSFVIDRLVCFGCHGSSASLCHDGIKDQDQRPICPHISADHS